jgi:alkanesulfonate monooxygenase SsuD/methylene tetrahydromethanopterin reductase-like flavin-dependent oxidoreductase (luciferase family)
LGDGWLVSSVSPQEVEAGIKTIRAYAADAGREIPEDHYGVLIPFCFAANGDRAFEIAERSIRPRDDLPTSAFTALGSPDEVRAKVQSYIRAGATKFVMRPCGPFEGWREQTEILAREVIQPLQTPAD